MVCDVLPLCNGYILAADQLPVFVHTERLSKTQIKISLSVCTKTDN